MPLVLLKVPRTTLTLGVAVHPSSASGGTVLQHGGDTAGAGKPRTVRETQP